MPAKEHDDDPGLTAQLADETAAANEPWPAEWPELRPLLNLSRLDRAAVFDGYADVIEKIPDLNDEYQGQPTPPDPNRPKGNAGRATWAAYAADRQVTVTKDMGRDAIIAAVDAATPVDPGLIVHNSRRAALVMRLVARLEDVVVLAAVDADATRQWLATASDWDVLTMFIRYARRTQLGEASSSGS
jgi:hypothetical protein